MTTALTPSPPAANPLDNPTAPALNKGIVGSAYGAALVGILGALASFVGAAPAGVNPNVAGGSGVALAVAGLGLRYLHGSNVGKRIDGYLKTARGIEAQFAPYVAPLTKTVDDMAAGNTHAGNIINDALRRIAALESTVNAGAAKAGIPDLGALLRRAADLAGGTPATGTASATTVTGPTASTALGSASQSGAAAAPSSAQPVPGVDAPGSASQTQPGPASGAVS